MMLQFSFALIVSRKAPREVSEIGSKQVQSVITLSAKCLLPHLATSVAAIKWRAARH